MHKHSIILANFDELVKSRKSLGIVIPAKPVLDSIREPESSNFNKFWMPDQVRHDGVGTFYEAVKLWLTLQVYNEEKCDRDATCLMARRDVAAHILTSPLNISAKNCFFVGDKVMHSHDLIHFEE